MALTYITKRLIQTALGTPESASNLIDEIEAQGAAIAAAQAEVDALSESTIRVAKIDVGFAALNAAGTGVPAVFNTGIPVGAIITTNYFDVTEAFEDDDTNASTLAFDIGASEIIPAAAISADYDAGLVGIIDHISKDAQEISFTFAESGPDVVLTAGALTVYITYNIA